MSSGTPFPLHCLRFVYNIFYSFYGTNKLIKQFFFTPSVWNIRGVEICYKEQKIGNILYFK